MHSLVVLVAAVVPAQGEERVAKEEGWCNHSLHLNDARVLMYTHSMDLLDADSKRASLQALSKYSETYTLRIELGPLFERLVLALECNLIHDCLVRPSTLPIEIREQPQSLKHASFNH